MSKLPSVKNSNIAMIGSSEDLQSRVKAAKTEKEWKGAGTKVGLEIWRIEKFNIKRWPKIEFGKFYGGDCYIILNTYKKGSALRWDVHFWLGAECTQDEKGVAAYKTVELDDLLGTLPVQHREVQGYESNLFMSYFKNETITIMKGGIDSGFNHVKPTEYKARLFHIKGKRKVKVHEVDLARESLNKGDAFVLDNGLDIMVWLPSKSGATEKFKANRVADELKNSRKGAKKEILGEKGSDRFWKLLGGKGKIKGEKEVELDEVYDKLKSTYKKQLWKLSDETGKMKFEKIQQGKLDKAKLDTMDVFIVDSGPTVICWIGNKATKAEKTKAVMYAQGYLGFNKRPVYIPITRVMEGREGSRFWELFK